MILHTRASTHGSPKDNDNNHPVVSPSGDLRLVHNGVIYNHEEIRSLLGKVGKGLPDVDSSVIPALIEEYGLEASSELSGYAAAAWFDRETDDAIHLARFKQAPVVFATLYDGSLAFASTEEILGRALNTAGVAWWGSYPKVFDSMGEGEYFQLLEGEIIATSEVEWKSRYEWKGPDYSSATSGGTSYLAGRSVGSTNNVTPIQGSEQKALVVMGNDEDAADEEDGTPSDVWDTWGYDGDTGELFGSGEKMSEAEMRNVVAMVFSDTGKLEDLSEEEFENWMRTGNIHGDADVPDIEDLERGGGDPLFYAMGHDGDYTTYTTLAGLISKLAWESGVVGAENHLVGPDEGTLRWVNHFSDIGALSEDGSEQNSWVTSQGDFQVVEHLVPGWVGEGLSRLRTLVGA